MQRKYFIANKQLSGKPPALDLPVYEVGRAPWSPAAKEMEKRLRERLSAPPKNPSGKGRKTRRHHRRGKKSKYTRRR